MPSQLSTSSDFTETLAVHAALKAALKSRLLDKNPAMKKAALRLSAELESDSSIFGRQLKMLNLMEKGTTVAELGRRLRTSRRTLFRYLNYLENAGIQITLENNKYHVDKNVSKLLRG